MSSICQRYAFEAIHNFWHLARYFDEMSSICQRYAFEAIHNGYSYWTWFSGDVFNMPKIRFWSNSQLSVFLILLCSWCLQYAKDTLLKQFTTQTRLFPIYFWCLQYAKDTLLKQFTTYKKVLQVCGLMSSICQRYAFEAIHNFSWARFVASADVFNMPKIRFWSNSQLLPLNKSKMERCLQYAKDTLLKQFTTLNFTLSMILFRMLAFCCNERAAFSG